MDGRKNQTVKCNLWWCNTYGAHGMLLKRQQGAQRLFSFSWQKMEIQLESVT